MRIFVGIIFVTSLWGGALIDPMEAMRASFDSTEVRKSTHLLDEKQMAYVAQRLHAPLESKIVRLFTAYRGESVVGYGIVHAVKLRTKNGAFLTMLDPDGVFKAVEIVAFGEPMEYAPSQTWLAQLPQGIEHASPITGATLTANGVKRSVHIAQAIWHALFGEVK